MDSVAVLAIDLQNGLFARRDSLVHDAAGVLEKADAVIAAAAERDIPIVVIQDDAGPGLWEPDTDGWRVHPTIRPPPGAVWLRKRFGDAFRGTSLDDELKRLRVRHLVILGAMSDFSVRATLQRALMKGYSVTLVTDAHSTLSGIDAPAEDHIDALNREVNRADRTGMAVDGAPAAEVARRFRGATT